MWCAAAEMYILKHLVCWCFKFVLAVLAKRAANTRINIPEERQTHATTLPGWKLYTNKTAAQEVALTEIYLVCESK